MLKELNQPSVCLAKFALIEWKFVCRSLADLSRIGSRISVNDVNTTYPSPSVALQEVEGILTLLSRTHESRLAGTVRKFEPNFGLLFWRSAIGRL